MIPWDQAYLEARSIANAVGVPAVDVIASALLEADAREVERLAHMSAVFWPYMNHRFDHWADVTEWDREEWREAVRRVMMNDDEPLVLRYIALSAKLDRLVARVDRVVADQNISMSPKARAVP